MVLFAMCFRVLRQILQCLKQIVDVILLLLLIVTLFSLIGKCKLMKSHYSSNVDIFVSLFSIFSFC